MNTPDLLNELSERCGIATEYTDIWGESHTLSRENQRSLLAALGIAVDSEAALQEALEQREARAWQRLLAPVLVVRQAGPLQIPLNMAAHQADTEFAWKLVTENGEQQGGVFRPRDLASLAVHPGTGMTRYGLVLPFPPALGYHRFEISRAGQPLAAMRLIVAPAACYQPAVLASGGRVWGLALQLYALRSPRNWGIGDLSDLKAALETAAELGAAMVSINPLHALFPNDATRASPYSPSSRLFYQILYLDVEAIAEFADCPAAQAMVSDPQFQARLRALRASELVDYKAVADIKLPVLERLYQHFREQQLGTDSPRGKAFQEFQASEGEPLYRQALFEALQAHFYQEDPAVWGWPAWPEPYRHPDSAAVREFAAARRERVEFYQYLQWQLAEQLAAVDSRSQAPGMGIGLCHDLAVSTDRSGGEVWANQHLYAIDANVGAPPDQFSPSGQDWGLPPLNPESLHEAAYQPFIELLRKNMRYAGALRIDHVMGLMRLYWIPGGAAAAEGAYVDYPFADLLGILALESQRNQCLVIGEDLGTVPDEVRSALAAIGVLSYRLLYFEKEADGSFKPPSAYPSQALVAVTTHDLPTLNGYWQGVDLDLRDRLGLFPSREVRDTQLVERAQDRARLRVALEREELLPPEISVHSVSDPEMGPQLICAVYRYLARSPAQILMVQLEDVFGRLEQANLPGTTEQYPNWQFKLPVLLEEWAAEPRLQMLSEALGQERGVPARPFWPTVPKRTRVRAHIPDATYRLQFNSGFGFAQASAIVAYLRDLGISHCYASPYLKARPGSTHGYDIIDHNALNPEIGSREDFEQFSETLRRHGMGQILDIVPNHMGVMGSDNAWWLDVLENGPASVNAPFFDIDWQPLEEELRNKVLLPVLGDNYGLVLAKGELKLVFDPQTGAFSIQYYNHRFPVDPREYPRILSDRIEQLAARLGSEDLLFLEYQSLITAFRNLPARTALEPEQIAERNRDKEIHKLHLANLCKNSPDIALFLEENVQRLNGAPGDPDSFDALHALLEAQAYRLAFWRVAADDINYRRFFDINDLAGLRMENDTVFQYTHRLIYELLSDGKLDGLRIDHPDGLYDPKQYFQRLQEALVTPAQAAAEETDAKPVYVVVEKILESYERLSEEWPVHGTTGYDFANLVNAVLVNPEAEQPLTQIYARFIGEEINFEELLYECKKLIMKTALASELNVLAHQLRRIAEADRRTRDFTLNGLRRALQEVVACFPVYRTYISQEGFSEDDRRYINWAVSVAKKRSQAADISIFDFVQNVLLTRQAEGKPPACREQVLAFAMKFQQYTGPLMAKGLEDTAFYRYNRLLSLNEVGGDPRRFSFSVNGFHIANQERARLWPHAMLATSTHDSKRSEDVRARLNVLSELPDEWDKLLQRWSRLNQSKQRLVDNAPAPSLNDQYLLYQTLLGAWPLVEPDETGYEALRERIENYMLKAVKEAKLHSSWINPNPDYEEAVVAFIRALLKPEKNRFLEDFLPFQRRIARLGLFNSLSQTLIKLTAPGVPDIYQGNELWDFSLVDPDNRRPVDYDLRRRLLGELQGLVDVAAGELPLQLHRLLDRLEDGRTKLYVTWKTLQFRRQHSALFRYGAYVPLAVSGAKEQHVCAFARIYENSKVVVVAPRLFSSLLNGAEQGLPLGRAAWGDTQLILPDCEAGAFVNVFSGASVDCAAAQPEAALALADILEHFPVALLIQR